MTASPHAKPAHVVGFLPVVTLVLWTGSLLVGILGYTLHYVRPHTPATAQPTVAVEKISVELDHDQPTAANPDLHPAPSLTAPPLTPPLAVAAPSPSLAFPLPVTGPVSVVENAHADSSVRDNPSSTDTSVQPLVFGKGEGRQPAPGYPSTAIRQGQEGTVTVRLNVTADGRVTAAEVSIPSPWPLLNETAVRVVRDQWRFAPGASRTYEVAIRFTLQK